MKHLILRTTGIVLAAMLTTTMLRSQSALPGIPAINYSVDQITRGDGKMFIRGDFDWLGTSHGSNAAIFNTALGHDNSYPDVNYTVRLVESDDAGGWYIVSDATLVHIKADKTMEELPITTAGGGYSITAMDKAGNILYIGGQFTAVNGVPRKYVAAIDLTTNTLTNWDPNANGYVYDVKASGGTVYVGGSFTAIGGQTRAKIAAIDATTGLATSWNANVIAGTGYVYTIDAGPGAVYFGGSFANVATSSPTRRNFAAVNNTTGALITAINPRPDDNVVDILLDGSTLYIAGKFAQIGGIAKPKLAALNVTTGALTAFNTTFGSDDNWRDIYSMAVDGQKLFLGGNFLTINGIEQPRLAVVNKTTGSTEPVEDRKVAGQVYALAASGGVLFAGGSLTGITGVARSKGLAALDENTGQVTTWYPSHFAYRAENLQYHNNRVYYLTNESGTGFIGAVNTTDGAAIAGWQITADADITSWAFDGNTIYISGPFTTINGTAKTNFAAVDLTTGNVLPWTITYAPSYADGEEITSMRVSNNVLYVAGDFGFVSGSIERNNLAAWNATSGALLPWTPVIDLDTYGQVAIGEIHDAKVYLMGDVMRRADAMSGELDDWAPEFDDWFRVHSMAIRENAVFLAGVFSPGLVNVDISTGKVRGWQPDLHDVYESEGSVNAIALSETKLFTGGNFSYETSAGNDRYHYAMYALPGPEPVIAEDQLTTCAGTAAFITVAATGTGITYQWQKWNNDTGDFEDLADGDRYDGTTTETLTVIPTGDAVSEDYRCVVSSSSGDQPSNVATLTVNPSPPAPGVTGASGCSPGAVTLSAEGAEDGQYRWYDVSNGGDAIPDAINSIYITPTLSAATTYYVSIAKEACESERMAVVASITGPCAPPSITAQELTTQPGGTITIDLVPLVSTTGNNLDINSLQVTVPPSSGANASIAEGVLTITYTGIAFAGTEHITVQACDDYGNCTTQNFSISVEGDIIVYNALSPGGANPVLFIRNVELLPETKDNSVTIYDRWQNEVWRGKNYNNTSVVFSGAGNGGRDLPTGTYFYKIEFKGGRKTQTGFISLKR